MRDERCGAREAAESLLASTRTPQLGGGRLDGGRHQQLDELLVADLRPRPKKSRSKRLWSKRPGSKWHWQKRLWSQSADRPGRVLARPVAVDARRSFQVGRVRVCVCVGGAKCLAVLVHVGLVHHVVDVCVLEVLPCRRRADRRR